jgi:hypothetical protein
MTGINNLIVIFENYIKNWYLLFHIHIYL